MAGDEQFESFPMKNRDRSYINKHPDIYRHKL